MRHKHTNTHLDEQTHTDTQTAGMLAGLNVSCRPLLTLKVSITCGGRIDRLLWLLIVSSHGTRFFFLCSFNYKESWLWRLNLLFCKTKMDRIDTNTHTVVALGCRASFLVSSLSPPPRGVLLPQKRSCVSLRRCRPPSWKWAGLDERGALTSCLWRKTERDVSAG